VARSKDIGTRGESLTVKFLIESGFPYAERRALHGSTDLGDITGTPGLVWEVKAGEAAMGASDNQVIAWLQETETERVNARADLGTLVVQRRRKNPREWWAIFMSDDNHPTWMRLCDRAFELRRNGWGTPVTEGEMAA